MMIGWCGICGYKARETWVSTSASNCLPSRQHRLLRNSSASTISPTFSFLPTLNRISPLTNSLPHWTDTGTFPDLSTTPRSCYRCASLFHLSCLQSVSLLHQSFGPLVSISILYAFHFRFRSCSAFATQHRFLIPFPLSPISPMVIGQYPLI